jgi:hypothetical protein
VSAGGSADTPSTRFLRDYQQQSIEKKEPSQLVEGARTVSDLNKRRDKDYYVGIGLSLGLALMTPLGIILALVTDTPGLLGIGPAMGIGIGLAIGQGLYERQRQQS